MADNNKVCTCGSTEFIGSQSCRGTVSVVCTLTESGPFKQTFAHFVRNNNEKDRVDVNDLDFDNPEGPFACAKCGKELEAK